MITHEGVLDFRGRKDKQVKVRGNRIELGEIERKLVEVEEVKDNVVMVIENSRGISYICAYVIPTNNQSLEASELKAQLKQSLPSYMIPDYFTFMDEFPLTQNGKLDRKALPVPQSLGLSRREYVKPRNATEKQLINMLEEVLDLDTVSVLDNFFELGGNSLKAISLSARIDRNWKVGLSMKDIFTHPTAEGLAEQLILKNQIQEETDEQADEDKSENKIII